MNDGTLQQSVDNLANGTAQWWLAPDSDTMVNQAWAVMDSINTNTLERQKRLVDGLNRYEGWVANFSSEVGVGAAGGRKSRAYVMNVIGSIIETLKAKFAGAPVRLFCQTSEGDYEAQERAKGMTAYLDGVFYENKMSILGPEAQTDALWGDIGALHVCENPHKPGRILIERILPHQMLIDPRDGLFGKPRQLMVVRYVSKDVLCAQFPRQAHLIRDNVPYEERDAMGNFMPTSVVDAVKMVEAWHLPSKAGAKDGKHIIFCQGVELFSEKWTEDFFPLAFTWFVRRPLGFFGTGVTTMLSGLQEEMNKLESAKQRALYLHANPRWFVKSDSGVVPEHITNDPQSVLTGLEEPKLITTNPVSEQLAAQTENLYKKMYEISGVSQMSAQSTKPQDLESGEALRVFHDIGSDRFKMLNSYYEQMNVDLGYLILWKSEQLGGMKVKVPGVKNLRIISYEDVKMDLEQFVLKVYPTNALSKDPAHRISTLSNIIQGGLDQRPEFLSLLEFPDLEAFISQLTAPRKNIEWQISQILSHGEYVSPEPYQDLELGLRLFTEAYLNAQRNGVPEKYLNLMRTWMDQAQAMLQPPPQPPAPPPPMAPPPMGAPPPMPAPAPPMGPPVPAAPPPQ